MNRADFPILDRPHPNGVPLSYLDNAATSHTPTPVLERIARYYETENANVHRGMHHLAAEATRVYESAREQVAAFLGVPDTHTLLFTRGTTEGINLVARSWSADHLGPGDTILLTRMEHHSNIVPWQLAAAATGARLRYLDIDEHGALEPADFTGVKLFAVTHVSNALGTENPVRELVRQARAAGAVTLVDGAQAVPHHPVDLAAIDPDFYTFSGHKMCGPTGIGALVARTALLEAMPPFQAGGEMIDQVLDDHSTWADLPYKFEAGTPNIAGAAGLAAAAAYVDGIGMERIETVTNQLAQLAATRLDEVPGLTRYGPDVPGAALSFNLEGIHPHDLAQILDQEGVAIRAGHLCCQPLMRRLGVPAVARASFYFYNTAEEVDRLVHGLHTARRIFRL